MLDRDGIRVSATRHATERALKRVPCLRGKASEAYARRWVEVTAHEALTAGRRARRLPKWCVKWSYGQSHRPHLDQPGTWRFLWDADESVVLLARYGRDIVTPDRSTWVVVTTMAP